MRLGIGSYTFGWAVAGGEGIAPLTAQDLIDRAVQMHVGVVQLCDNLPPRTYSDQSVRAISDYATRREISIELGTRGTHPAHLCRFIQIAKQLKSAIMRVVIDDRDDHPSPTEVIRRLKQVLPELENAGITLAIENHDRFPAAVLADMLDQSGSQHLGICLDTANSFGAAEGPRAVVAALGQWTVNLHLKDFAITRFPHLQGFTIEGRPAGEGLLDIPWLLAELKNHGRDPTVIAELWTPPEPTALATIQKEADWARRSVTFLRQYIRD